MEVCEYYPVGSAIDKRLAIDKPKGFNSVMPRKKPVKYTKTRKSSDPFTSSPPASMVSGVLHGDELRSGLASAPTPAPGPSEEDFKKAMRTVNAYLKKLKEDDTVTYEALTKA